MKNFAFKVFLINVDKKFKTDIYGVRSELANGILWIYIQGVSKKRGICFMIIISIKLNTNLLGIYLIWKVGSIAPSGVQKQFCTISGSRGISKEILGTRFQKFERMNNLIALNLILPRFMHTFSSYEHFRRLGNILF